MTEYESKYSEERDKRLPPEKVMDVIGVEPGMVIGEAGAGNGYFTFKLRSRIGKDGAVYANDNLPRILRKTGIYPRSHPADPAS